MTAIGWNLTMTSVFRRQSRLFSRRTFAAPKPVQQNCARCLFLKRAPKAVPPRILEMITAHRNSQVLMTACDLRIFDELEKNRGRPIAALDLATRLDLDPDPTERLLNILVGMKLLKKHWDIIGTGLFANTEESRQYFLSAHGSVLQYTKEEFLNGLSAFTSLKETLHTGHSILGLSKDRKTPESEIEEMKAKHDLHIAGIAKVVKAFDLSECGYNTALIIGDCSAVALEMCRVHPHLSITYLSPRQHVVDHVDSVIAADPEDKAEFTSICCDFMKEEDLPTADLIVLCHSLCNHNPEEVRNLLTRCYENLRPKGAVVILEKLLNDHKTGPMLTLTDNMMQLLQNGGKCHSPEEFAKILKPIGFGNIQIKLFKDNPFFDILLGERL